MSVKRMKPKDMVRAYSRLQSRGAFHRSVIAAEFVPRNRAERRASKRVAE